MQEKLILYYESRTNLLKVIDGLVENGATINVVINITPMQDPHMNGDSVATWLILYQPKSP